MPTSAKRSAKRTPIKAPRTHAKALFGPTGRPAIARIYATLAERISPETELVYADHFQLLVAVVLSAQATDVSVNAATPKLFAAAPTPAAMARLTAEGILPFIRSIGLAPTKARHVAALSRLLLERHDGEVPRTRAELEALPGVGHKTASVVLNVAFGEPTIAVDTHVHRVANRLGIAVTRTPKQTETVLLARTPPEYRRQAHHYLILHGRYTCMARAPTCGECPLARWCPSRNLG